MQNIRLNTYGQLPVRLSMPPPPWALWRDIARAVAERYASIGESSDAAYDCGAALLAAARVEWLSKQARPDDDGVCVLDLDSYRGLRLVLDAAVENHEDCEHWGIDVPPLAEITALAAALDAAERAMRAEEAEE